MVHGLPEQRAGLYFSFMAMSAASAVVGVTHVLTDCALPSLSTMTILPSRPGSAAPCAFDTVSRAAGCPSASVLLSADHLAMSGVR